MNFYKFNLLLVAVLLIVLYFKIPFYESWLSGKALSPNNNMFDQMRNLDTNYRRQYRFGSTYMFDKDIVRVLSTHKDQEPILLLPTNEFLKANSIPNDLDMQEPAVFYYFTGIKSVWASSTDAGRANWVLIASKKMGMRIMDIKSKEQLDSLITMYKPFAK